MSHVKTILKLIVCSLLYYTGILHIYLKCFFLKRREYPAIIINYHRFVKSYDDIIEVHPSVTHNINDFKKELDFLTKYFDIRPLDEVVSDLTEGRKFTKPVIALTIDDGFKDNYDLMFPLLKEKNIPATIFLSTAVIGTNKMNWFDRFANVLLHTPSRTVQMNGLLKGEVLQLNSMNQKREAYNYIVQQLKDVDVKERDRYLENIENQLGSPQEDKPLMLNWDDVRTMSKSNISFGAHTHTHPILTKMPVEEAKDEIARSKQMIEDNLGMTVKHFAYPNGRPIDFNEDLRAFCRNLQFASISTFDYGNNGQAEDVWALKRIGSEAPISLFALNVVRAFFQKGSLV